MWKYLTKDKEEEFLLSLNLLDGTDKEILNKLYTISNNKEENYKVFKIKKRNGKYRTIYEPNYTLKNIQKNILKNILESRHISPYAKAYKKGITLKDNVQDHLNKKIVLKLDIESFFNNITYMQVYCSCFSIDFFPKSIGTILTNLCTYQDFLPQGTPTASYISNLVMLDFDTDIAKYCQDNDISYTRYCDDITFSGDFNYHEIIKVVSQNLSKLGFKLNKNKIKIVSHKSRQVVTGIVVNEKMQVNVDYRKKIRQEVYYIKKYGLIDHMNKLNLNIEKDVYLNKLLGKINFILEVDETNQEFISYKKYIISLKKSG